MKPPFGLDPSVANTIITALSTLIAGLLGGWLGSRATKKATERALEQNLALQEDNRRAVLRGVLLGIRAEFEQLLEIAKEENIGPDATAAVEKGEGLHIIYPIYQNYFTVYESNAPLIGQIPDDELRSAIIKSYLLAVTLFNTLKHNNELEAKHEELKNDLTGASRGEKFLLEQSMSEYASVVKGAYDIATSSANQLFILMDNCEFLKSPDESITTKT